MFFHFLTETPPPTCAWILLFPIPEPVAQVLHMWAFFGIVLTSCYWTREYIDFFDVYMRDQQFLDNIMAYRKSTRKKGLR